MDSNVPLKMQKEATTYTANEQWEIEHFELLKNELSTEAISLKLRHLPKSFYRYRALKSEYDLEGLKNMQFYLSHPDAMNDPYESSLTWDSRELSNAVLKESMICERGNGFYGTLSDAEITRIREAKDSQREILKLLEEKEPNSVGVMLMDQLLTHMAEEQSKKMQLRLETQIKDGIKFCCFSSRNDSILMWSHYANEHRGICVEYDFQHYHLRNSLYPIIYVNQVTDVGRYLVRKDPSFIVPILAVTQKALDWQYEKEWRLAVTHGILDQPLVNSPKPIAIYMGARISETDKAEVSKLCTELDIPAIQMFKDPKAFRIRQMP